MNRNLKLAPVLAAVLVSMATAPLISFAAPSGPESDPYWCQFVGKCAYAGDVALAPSGPESDPYWSQFVPQPAAPASVGVAAVPAPSGPQADPYWCQFVPAEQYLVEAPSQPAVVQAGASK
jgi:hypothetical protein